MIDVTDTPMQDINLSTHSLTGWPHEAECVHCGARAVMCCGTFLNATYECRGTPTDPRSAYGPDRCGRVFRVESAKRAEKVRQADEAAHAS